MTAPVATDRLASVFATAREQGRGALVGYLPAGFPTAAGGMDAVRVLADCGVDLLEVGVPYSDPLMDGPVIQAAVDRALAQGTGTRDVLATVEAATAAGLPAVVMSYWNPIEKYGPARFARDLAAAGGLGMITPDLIPEEAGAWLAAADDEGLAPVFLVAPASTAARIRQVGQVNRGFVYAASTMGVTGTRAAVASTAAELVARVREQTDLPVAVGLGVSDGRQAAEVTAYADGVIVGSALVRALAEANGRTAGLAALGALARDLAAGVRGGAGA
ncbi:MAG: tryptophan synthase, alpha chain [Mycobacterium sp.]|nr:tryptophan synthase, alpha chain [Mycobacterium sp.]MCW2744598.1 tryptophan synthase, alpha chain [Mycobacterium sp.]